MNIDSRVILSMPIVGYIVIVLIFSIFISKAISDIIFLNTVSIIFGIFCFIIIKKLLITKLLYIEKISNEISRGNVNIEIKFKKSNDILDNIIYNLYNIKEFIIKKDKIYENNMSEIENFLNEIYRVMKAISNGSLTERISKQKGNKLEKLRVVINNALDSLSRLIGDLIEDVKKLNSEIHRAEEEVNRIKETSEQIADAANQVAVAATD
ncbi:methyl-accepting chemotaxis sensory transducer, partial [Methanocaldococcus villosus KIN24-T80]